MQNTPANSMCCMRSGPTARHCRDAVIPASPPLSPKHLERTPGPCFFPSELPINCFSAHLAIRRHRSRLYSTRAGHPASTLTSHNDSCLSVVTDAITDVIKCVPCPSLRPPVCRRGRASLLLHALCRHPAFIERSCRHGPADLR